MRLCVTLLAASFTVGCASTHTIPPPLAPNPEQRVEIGPIVDDEGVDLGPVIADDMSARGLAHAEVAEEPSGKAPYVEGRVRMSHAHAGSTASSTGAYWLLIPGSILLTGGIVILVGQGVAGSDNGGNNSFSDNPQGSTAGTISGVLVGVGAAMVVGGIILALQPGHAIQADVSADLQVYKNGAFKPLVVHDEVVARHPNQHPEQAGPELVSGVSSAICTETSGR